MRLIKNNQTGFSLVELLVTSTIVALLAAAGLVSYTTANRNARNAKRKSDLEQVRATLELYRTEEGCYPGSSGCSLSSISMTSMLQELQSESYMSDISNIKDPRDAAGYAYTYRYSSSGIGTCTAYCMCAEVENLAGNSSNDTCSFVGSSGDYYCVCNP